MKYNAFCRAVALLMLVLICLLTVSCEKDDGIDESLDEPVLLDMNTEYSLAKKLQRGNGERVKVILLLGQSNASGSSIVSYLEKNSSPDDFARYKEGYPSVLINYCIDDHNACSKGEYVKVDLTCGAASGFFGPEVGMAEELSVAYPDETVFILKYTMSGYSLHQHWLSRGQRGSIYNAFLAFAMANMKHLETLGYEGRIGAVCWMQGESDTTDHKGERYFENQKALVSYIREDLAPYAEEGGIYFIDAGISNGPYCEPAYPAVNEAKRQFSELSPLNIYFSTIDEGLTTLYEPEGEPDYGHYDALCELELGRIFADHIIESYKKR
ncbi:MAG: sialate O-acetylesterase [Ruminococcaceae bacterium]|nr:sialate O-acetylesterase [Oscillospiraceae bacterium]